MSEHRKNILYDFEHRYLRDIFYRDCGKSGMAARFAKSSFFQHCFQEYAFQRQDDDEEIGYTDEDFQVRVYGIPAIRGILIRAGMPEEQGNLLCRAVYLLFPNTYSQPLYLISERTGSGYQIAALTEDGNFVSFGDAPKDPEVEARRILAHYHRWPGKKEELKNGFGNTKRRNTAEV